MPTFQQRLCGDIGMRIDHHGDWYYQGSLIERKELVKLFSKILRRDHGGDHWLITPAEIAHVRVDDAAHVVVDMDIKGIGSNQIIYFQTMVDTIYALSETYPLRIEMNMETQEPAPYLVLDQGLEAKLNRSGFIDLANLAIEKEIEGGLVFGIWSAGTFHVIWDST